MIVTPDKFDTVCSVIWNESEVSIDTETTGLKPYQGSRLFSLIVGTDSDTYYFNFNNQPDHLGVIAPVALPRDFIAKLLTSIAINPTKIAYLANAKFDMHILAQEGVAVWECTVHDVLVMDRLKYNDHMNYSLAAVAKRSGFEKSEEVDEYIKKNKLWRWVSIPGKKKRDKDKFYNLVPFEIMTAYGERDARITFDIGRAQRQHFLNKNWDSPRETLLNPYETELRMTKVLYRMEREGIPVDAELCERRAAEETSNYEKAAREFKYLTGVGLVDSAKTLSPVFAALGLTPPQTDKGNDSFTDEWLASVEHPVAKVIQTYRAHAKLANTYYKNFLWFRDARGLIHANARQAGTRTGRLSYSDPNLQNVPDVDEVREAFLAPENFCLVSMDWDQQEYKVMLEYAEQMDLIAKILGGLDVHTSTAQLMSVERKPAKTLNFMLLYGGGTVKLALALFPVTVGENELWVIWKEHNEWDLDEDDLKVQPRVTDAMRAENLPHLEAAQALRDLYFERLPSVSKWIDRVKRVAKERGFVRSWTGRELFCKVKKYAYKMPNAIIQGGCSEIAKHAMIRIDERLRGYKSKLLVQIHDEMVFKIHRDELHLVDDLKNIMETAFPGRYLPLTCSVSHSWQSWGSLKDGPPSGETGRDEVQGKGLGGFEDSQKSVGA